MNFDGLIKCVFSGFEARLCADVPVPVHEIRLHPYLFPVGLGGAPTFTEGGDPGRDAKAYWRQVRRALLRKPVERIGLGGYLHLTEGFPEFVDCIGDDRRGVPHDQSAARQQAACMRCRCRVAVLTAWGKLRSWTLSGHFHEAADHDLIHILECLAGLPVDVTFIDFDDVKSGALQGMDAVHLRGAQGHGVERRRAVERRAGRGGRHGVCTSRAAPSWASTSLPPWRGTRIPCAWRTCWA